MTNPRSRDALSDLMLNAHPVKVPVVTSNANLPALSTMCNVHTKGIALWLQSVMGELLNVRNQAINQITLPNVTKELK